MELIKITLDSLHASRTGTQEQKDDEVQILDLFSYQILNIHLYNANLHRLQQA